MKIGYSTWGMPTIPVDTFVPFLARLGYEGIELTVFPGYTIDLSLLDAAERQRITNNRCSNSCQGGSCIIAARHAALARAC
jgi:hypothetical protein